MLSYVAFPKFNLVEGKLVLSSSAAIFKPSVLTKHALGSARLNVCTPAKVLGMSKKSMYITHIIDDFEASRKKGAEKYYCTWPKCKSQIWGTHQKKKKIKMKFHNKK